MAMYGRPSASPRSYTAMMWGGEPRGRLRLAAEALDELAVLGVALGHHLERDLAAEARVLGQVDRRHAAHAQAPEHAERPSNGWPGWVSSPVIAAFFHGTAAQPAARAVESASRSGIEHRPHDVARDRGGRLAAVLGGALDDDRQGDLRASAGANAMNHASSCPGAAVLGRARLAGDLHARDLRGGAVPSPRRASSSVTAAAVCGLNARLSGSLWRW